MRKEKTVILFLAANPRVGNSLKIMTEFRAIREAIKASGHREHFVITEELAIQPSKLWDCIRDHNPRILHFSGHGAYDRRLVLHGPKERGMPLTAANARYLFGSLAHNIRLVVLNACYSSRFGNALTSEIDCVVGLEGQVHDDTAREFAEAFYREIASFASIGTAVGAAQYALRVSKVPATIRLRCKPGVDADSVLFAPERISRSKIPDANSSPVIAPNDSDRREPEPRARSIFRIKLSNQVDLLSLLSARRRPSPQTGFGALAPGLHMGRARQFELIRAANSQVLLRTWPQHVEIATQHPALETILVPSSIPDSPRLFEYQPQGDATDVPLTIRVEQGTALLMTITEQKERGDEMRLQIQY